MRFFYRGETFGTKDVLTAAAVVRAGESVHPAHRHAEEEYLILAKGSGTWHLNGKEFPAREGDVLYVEPWHMHGLINTSDEPLTFYVVRWTSKGVTPPPEPEGSHGR
jgi:mannose-6-phosphate isomerase-like protein (cupin superfamily)